VTEEFDSEGWRKVRNDKLLEWVGDSHAVQFILHMGQVAEVWDDLIDRDKDFDDNHIHSAFWALLIELPLNPFFDRFKGQLIPLMTVGINTWLDSNVMQDGDEEEQIQAYVLRRWLLELSIYVVYLTRGREYAQQHSLEIRKFFTRYETFADFRAKLGETV